MDVDPWNYWQVVGESQIRQAAGAVSMVVGCAAEVRDGAVYVSLDRPWWSWLTFGVWRWQRARKVRSLCVAGVPRLLGWCPEVRIE